jgi:hypothetical protein
VQELVAGLGTAVAIEAHLDQLLAAAARGLHSRKLYWVGHARLVLLCSHTAHHLDYTVTLAPAAGTRGYRWWEVGQRTVDCAAVKKPMDLRRREYPSRGQNSPWQ